jgi:hypothetical protein
MNTNNLIVSGYKITESNEVINQLYGITPEIQEKLVEMSVKVQKKKNSAIKELNDLIKKYPFVPQFKNFLSMLYDMQGNHFMANEVNRRLVSLHPEYLFGRLTLANIAIANEEYEKVPEILCEAMELKSMYPEREEFHTGEVVGFLQTAFNYFIGIEDVVQAQIRLDIIEKLNKEFDLGIDMFNFDRKIMVLNLGKSLERQEQEWSTERTPEVIAKKIVEPTTEAPQFTHQIINELYCNDLNIDQQIISEILALPRETLLADLHKVVYDSMARHTLFMVEMDWNIKTHEFLMHALLLLVELKDESSIEVILDILRQDSDYLESWFSDAITEDFWEFIYHIANDKLDVLHKFISEPNRNTYARSIMTEVAQQVLIYQPKRRTEVIDWYKSIFEEWIENEDDDSIIDTELIAFFVSDAVNVNMIELKPQIIQLFELGLVAKGVSGSLESCLKDINRPSTYSKRKDVFASISERYKYLTSTWFSYTDDDIQKYNNKDIDVDEVNEYNNQHLEMLVPPQGEKPKVGRNDACPCGSGKKYKKCCLGK